MENDNVIIQHGQYKTISTFAEYLPAESEEGYIRIVKPFRGEGRSRSTHPWCCFFRELERRGTEDGTMAWPFPLRD